MDTYEKIEKDYQRIKAQEFQAEVEKHVRPEVWKFALLMEERLRANDHKAGWKDETPSRLLPRIEEETDELSALFLHSQTVLSSENVGKEAADIANFCMMVADISGALT